MPGFAQTQVGQLAATKPTFVAIDANRNIGGTTATWLYVSEHGNTDNTGGGQVLRYNLTSGSTTPTVIATRGTANGQFIAPDGIVVDPATGDLFIADRAQDKVQRLHNDGTFVMSFGSGTVGAADEMHGPAALARDSSGNIYVTEHGETLPVNSPGSGGSFVSKYTATGSRVWRIGGIGSANGQFANTGPYGVAVSGSSLLVSDGFNSRVQTFDLNGAYQSQFPITGTLPLGLTIDSAGNFWITESSDGGNGSIQQSQKATVAGAYAGVTLSGGLSLPFDTAVDTAANKAYVTDYGHDRVVIFDLAATPPAAVPTINSSASASGTVGTAFNYQITATNSPTSYALADTLPAGLSLNTTTGVISGTPTAAGNVTSHLTATNSSGTSAQFALAFSIAAATPPPAGDTTAPTISSFAIDLSTATQTTASYLVTFSEPVTGVDAADFQSNPRGSATATITGVTPISTSEYRVSFNYSGNDGSIQMAIKTAGTGIQDAAGNAFVGGGITASDDTSVNNAPPADMTLPTATVAAGTAGASSVPFTVTFSEAVTGVNAADFVATSAGGATASVGAVTGSGTTYTVAVPFTGNGTVQLMVVGGATANIKDAGGNLFGASATSSAVTVGSGGGTPSAPTIANQTVSATQNVAVNYQVVATGATSFSITNGTLPAGLSMSAAGLITGTPSASGSSTVTVQATNAGGNASATVTVNVAAAGSAPTIANQTVSATQNAAVNYQVVATGATSFSLVSGTFPAGLSMNAAGVISGTPTASGSSTVTVKATNANGSTNATVTINVAAAGSAPAISNQTTTGTQSSSLSYQVQASGATSYSIVSGSLPAGVTMNSSGVISGTPTASGTFTVTVRATNAFGTTDATVTITVAAYVPPPPGAPVVSSDSLTLTSGIPMTYTVRATNSPTSFSIQNGPGGLTISKTGVISGTPIATGTYNTTVTATNALGSGTGTITFTITPSTGGGGGGGPVKKGQTVIFNAPTSVVFVGDTFKLAAQPSSGLPVTYTIISGNATVSGDNLLVTGAGSIVIRALQAGDATYLPASADVTITASKRAQQIPPPSNTTVHTDSPMKLAATSDSGLPITYSIVSGPAKIVNGQVVFTGTGTVVVSATQAGNSQYDGTTSTITLTANPVPRLINISSRLMVSANDANSASIAGFWVTGDAPKQILIRAVGPSLSAFGITNGLADPTLKVFDAKGNLVATNSGWNDDAAVAAAANGVSAFALSKGSKDAAVLLTLQPGSYTTQVQSMKNSGTVLIEVYDVTANAAVPTKQLINISTRGYVGTGDNVLIGGFAVSGVEHKKVLVRAIGPTLGTFNVAGTLSDPVLKIYDAKNNLIAQNDNWGTSVKVGSETPATAAEISAADTATGAFALGSGSKDAAVILDLAPGQYSAVVTGASNGTGAAMVEVYEIPNP